MTDFVTFFKKGVGMKNKIEDIKLKIIISALPLVFVFIVMQRSRLFHVTGREPKMAVPTPMTGMGERTAARSRGM